MFNADRNALDLSGSTLPVSPYSSLLITRNAVQQRLRSRSRIAEPSPAALKSP
jgi:hypothetical protein